MAHSVFLSITRASLISALGVSGIVAQQHPSTVTGIELYRQGRLAEARAELLRPVTIRDEQERALRRMYVGFTHVQDNLAEATRELQMAVRSSPLVLPDERREAPSRINAYREARKRVPVLNNLTIGKVDIRPFEASGASRGSIPIAFGLETSPSQAGGLDSPVSITIHDDLGRFHHEVFRGAIPRLSHAWDGLVKDSVLPTGSYRIRVAATTGTAIYQKVRISTTAPNGRSLRRVPEPLWLSEQDEVVEPLNPLVATLSGIGLIAGLVMGLTSEEKEQQETGWGILTVSVLVGGAAGRPTTRVKPNRINIQRNREMRAAFQRLEVEAEQVNSRIRMTTRVGLEPIGAPIMEGNLP